MFKAGYFTFTTPKLLASNWRNLRGLGNVWELVLDQLGEIVPQEETAGGVLNTPAHLNHVNKNLPGGGLLGLNVHSSN